MAFYLLISDAAPEQALPGLRGAGFDLKTLPLGADAIAAIDLAPRAVLVDGVELPGRAFALLSELRTRAVELPSVVIVREDQLETYPWHEVASDLLLPDASEAQIRARAAMLHRRAGGASEDELRLGALSINTSTYRVAVDGRPLELTYKEFELLRYLAASPGRVFTRGTLLREVWGYDFYGGARTVDVHVRRLRAKLGPENEHLIETVRGVGYRATDLLP